MTDELPPTLRAVLDGRLADGGALSVAATLDVGIAVASALAAVHKEGGIYRDVKPANVLAAGGVYELIDVGVATAAGLEQGSGGTSGYIDPFTIATGAPATPASDLYALGAMLFESVTGKLPAAAAAADGGGLRDEVLDGRVHAPRLAELAPGAPPALAHLVDRMLDPERDARPASGEEVVRALEEVRRALSEPTKRVSASAMLKPEDIDAARELTTPPAASPSQAPASAQASAPASAPAPLAPGPELGTGPGNGAAIAIAAIAIALVGLAAVALRFGPGSMAPWQWLLLGAILALAVPGLLHALRSRRRRGELDFNIIDESIHHLDTEDEPWTVHVEARVPGALDEERLRRAVAQAIRVHPMARAFQRRWRPWHTVYRWQIVDAPAIDALSVRECASDDELAGARATFQSTRVPIAEAPPFRVLLARHPDGDYVMLNVNHAASDGVGSLRLLRSIGLAYSEMEDAAGDQALAVRDLARTSAPLTLRQRWDRQLLLNKSLRDAIASPPSRIAIDGGNAVQGFGFVHRVLDEEATRAIARAKVAGGTVNDLLLGVLHVAIDRWNSAHERQSERIGTMMPVNVRPPEQWNETVANITYFVSVSTLASERAEPLDAVRAIARQTAQIKERGTAAALREILFASPALLIEVKRRMPALLGFGGNRFVDTAVLSNVGRVREPIPFGALGPASELWFSPPCKMPLGLGLGVATYEGRMFFMFRYRHAQWSAEAALRFADAYVELLARAAAPPAGTL